MEKITAYLKSTTDELLTKVSWPKRDELQSSTLIVVIAAFIFALVVYAIDIVASAFLGFYYQLFQ